jgi:hypothetical protein
VTSPADQILFLQRLQRLLSDGSFVATYKFALLHALADLAVVHGDDSGAELVLTTRAIAEEMIELYWRQALPFPAPGADGPRILKQNTGKQAAILLEIAAVQERGGTSLAQHRREGTAWERLVCSVERTVRTMPLWKLQTVGSECVPFLYENTGSGSSITLRPGVAFCLRAFYPLVVDLVRGAWLRHVRTHNLALLGESSDLSAFLFGTGRASLALFRPILVEAQDGDCFYCRRALRGPGEVDHFIPWSRYPVDLGHNFVLAHAACNRDKSDHLAAERHLERWLHRNHTLAAPLASAFDAAGIAHSATMTSSIGRWAYTQTAAIRGQVWEDGRRFTLLTAAWRGLFDAAPPGAAAG